LSRSIRRILTGQGFFEEQNFTFVSLDLIKKIGWTEMELLAEITNPVSEDFRYLKPSLLPYLLTNAGRNYRLGDPIRSFEIQKRFVVVDGDINEKTICCGVIPEKNGVLVAKGIVEELFKNIHGSREYVEVKHYTYGHPGRTLAVMHNGNEIGFIYELKPQIRRNFELPEGTAVFELSVTDMTQMEVPVPEYQKISRFPKVELDVSVVVDKNIRSQQVKDWIQSAEKVLLTAVELKDIYENQSLGTNKKSMTYSLTCQSTEGTLEDKAIQDILAKVIQTLERNGGVIRR
jgi:phenylalanyl-tRNA synthetase beta chain